MRPFFGTRDTPQFTSVFLREVLYEVHFFLVQLLTRLARFDVNGWGPNGLVFRHA